MRFNSTAAAFLALVMYTIPNSGAAQERLPDLLSDLAVAPDALAAKRLERSIYSEWSKSGSPAADFLLQRGESALERSDMSAALDHLQAATDHAPEFAQAWTLLGVVYVKIDLLGPAMAALEQALALNPNHFGAMHGVAAVNELVGNRRLAYQAYKRAAQMRPFEPEIEAALERLGPEMQGKRI